MNRVVAKIYLWCSFSYLLIFLCSQLLYKNEFLKTFSPLWIYAMLFILIIMQVYLSIHCFQTIKWIEPNRAILYLLWQCFLLASFLSLLPIVHTDLVIGMGHEAFLILSILYACFGGIGYFFNLPINTTVWVTILVLISLFLGVITPYFFNSWFFKIENVSDSMLYSGLLASFLSFFCSGSINQIQNKIQNDENALKLAPNYAFLTVFSFTYFILVIARVFKVAKGLEETDNSKK